MTDLDIDIWDRGRDAAAAGRFTLQALKANYPYVKMPVTRKSLSGAYSLADLCRQHFPDRINGVQYGFKTWSSSYSEQYVFFQSKEDAEYFRALLYII